MSRQCDTVHLVIITQTLATDCTAGSKPRLRTGSARLLHASTRRKRRTGQHGYRPGTDRRVYIIQFAGVGRLWENDIGDRFAGQDTALQSPLAAPVDLTTIEDGFYAFTDVSERGRTSFTSMGSDCALRLRGGVRKDSGHATDRQESTMSAVFDGDRKLNLRIESAAEDRDRRVASQRTACWKRRDIGDNENRFISSRSQTARLSRCRIETALTVSNERLMHDDVLHAAAAAVARMTARYLLGDAAFFNHRHQLIGLQTLAVGLHRYSYK